MHLSLTESSHSAQPSLTSISAPSSESTTLTGALPTASPNSTSPQPSLHLLQNTALAAVSCQNGDRWIIIQNMTGSLRGLYSITTNGHTSPWAAYSKDLNLTATRPNTPISASCAVISPGSESVDGTISAGLYVSRYISASYISSYTSIRRRTEQIVSI